MQNFRSRRLHKLFFCYFICGVVFYISLIFSDLKPALSQEVIQTTNSGSGVIIGEETTVFDLYLSDTFQGSALAHYTDDWMQIDDPKDLLSQIKGVSFSEEITPLLVGRIQKYRSLPEIGSVRFDLRTFRIILELKPKFLPEKPLKTTGRLPDPNREFSLLQIVRGASSGAVDESFSSTFNHRTESAYGKYFARLDGTVVDNQPYVLTEGFVGGVVGDYEVGSGFIQTLGQTFASSVDVVGFRMNTAEQVFADQELIRGSQFQVFIPSRSRVEFFRDGRLLTVQVLDYGLQDINTSSFPDGSYDVDIVINEDNGGVQRETKFYTKSGYLALTDKPVFNLSVGIGRDQLDIFEVPVYQSGVKWRVADALQLGGSIYGTDSISVGDISATSFYRQNFITAGFSANSNGNQGVYGNFTGNSFGFIYSMSMSETLNPDQKINDLVAINTNRDKELIIDRLNGLARERSNLSASISRTLIPNVQIGMLATKNRRVPDPFFSTLIPDKQKPIDDRYAYGPRLEWIILNDTQRALRFETFYLHADDGDNYTARLSFRYRFSPTVTGISEVRNTKTRGDKESSVINSATYDGTDLQRLGTRGVATNEVRETRRANGSGNSQSNSGTSIIDNLEVSHTNDYARGSGFVRDNRSSQADSTFLGVQGEGAFIVSDNGEVSVSRPIQDGAALVANLESETSKARFEVRLNDQLIGTLQAGERRIFGITPYRTYRVSIRPAENSEMLSYDNSSEEFTVFPGNIVSRTWKVNRVVVVIGRVIDSTGAPIKLKKIKGTRDFVATDENGNFQSDLAGDEKLFIDLKEGGCSIPTPDIDNFKDYLLDVGDVVCN